MNRSVVIPIILVAAFCVACSSEQDTKGTSQAAVISEPPPDPRGPLTRPVAERLIRAASNFPKKEEGPAFYLSWDGTCFNYRIDPCTADAMPYEVKTLQDLGLITVAFDGDTSRISLTEKGTQYAAGAPFETTGESGGRFATLLKIVIVAATVDFGQITGIQEFSQFNQAKVEYTVVSQPTPFGTNPVPSYNRRYEPVAIAKSATFTKYDDGWRLTTSN